MALLFSAGLVLAYQILANFLIYTIPYDYQYFARRYADSQYPRSSLGTYIISDYDLYSYAGYYYITGGEVSRVNFENPPLGKYLIGLSVVLFKNQLAVNIFYVIFYLVVTYCLGIAILKDRTVASLAVLFLSFDPYISQALFVPMLDFVSGLFFLCGLLFFIRARSFWDYAVSSGLFGMSIASKFFPFFIIAAFCFIAYQILRRRDKLFPYLGSLPLTAIIYLASYFEFFRRNSFFDFFRYQWWVIRWRMGNPAVLGNAFRTIFTGSFKPWWITAETSHSYTSEWSLFIPFMVGGAILSIFFIKNKLFRYLYLFVWIYLIYINVGTEGGLKYLAPFYGLFALLTAATFKCIDWYMFLRLIMYRIGNIRVLLKHLYHTPGMW